MIYKNVIEGKGSAGGGGGVWKRHTKGIKSNECKRYPTAHQHNMSRDMKNGINNNNNNKNNEHSTELFRKKKKEFWMQIHLTDI